MKTSLDCPRCDTTFDAETWEDGSCPECGNEYTWDEQCSEDLSDCWVVTNWSHYGY